LARDFTYVEDMLPAIASAAGAGPIESLASTGCTISAIVARFPLLDFISTLEEAIGRRAVKDLLPMQPGDVPVTYADIDTARRDSRFRAVARRSLTVYLVCLMVPELTINCPGITTCETVSTS